MKKKPILIICAVLLAAAAVACGWFMLSPEERAYLRWRNYKGARLTGNITAAADGQSCACTVTAGNGSGGNGGVCGLTCTEQENKLHFEIDTGGKDGSNLYIFTVQPENADMPPVEVKVVFGNWKDVCTLDVQIEADSSAGTVTVSGECKFEVGNGTLTDTATAKTGSSEPILLKFSNI